MRLCFSVAFGKGIEKDHRGIQKLRNLGFKMTKENIWTLQSHQVNGVDFSLDDSHQLKCLTETRDMNQALSIFITVCKMEKYLEQFEVWYQ